MNDLKKRLGREGYNVLLKEVVGYLTDARQASVRVVHSVMTSTYWLVGRRIVVFDQGGKERAVYGDALLDRVAKDLNRRLGRGFSRRNFQQMRLFYQYWPIAQTASAQLGEQMIWQTSSAKSRLPENSRGTARQFPLSWLHETGSTNHGMSLTVPGSGASRE